MAFNEKEPVFQEKYTSMAKSEVIKQYEHDYENFLELLQRAPNAIVLPNGWGIREILSHIAPWNLETIGGIQAVTRGQIPWFFDDDERLKTFNEEQIKKREEVSLPEILRELGVNHHKLLDFLGEFPESSFHRGFGQTWRGQPVTPSLVCSYRHYLDHAKDILDWFSPIPKD